MYFALRITVPWKASCLGNKKEFKEIQLKGALQGLLLFKIVQPQKSIPLRHQPRSPPALLHCFRVVGRDTIAYSPCKHRDRAWWKLFLWLYGVIQPCTYRISPTASMEYEKNVSWERHRDPGASIPWSMLTPSLGCSPGTLLYGNPLNCLLLHFLDVFGHGNLFSLKSINISWIL